MTPSPKFLTQNDDAAMHEGTQGRRPNITLTPATRTAIMRLIVAVESLEEREKDAKRERRRE